MWKPFASILALSMLFVTGCSKETDPADSPDNPNPAEKNTFTLTMPDGATDVAQGGQTQMQIGVDRGKTSRKPSRFLLNLPKASRLSRNLRKLPRARLR